MEEHNILTLANDVCLKRLKQLSVLLVSSSKLTATEWDFKQITKKLIGVSSQGILKEQCEIRNKQAHILFIFTPETSSDVREIEEKLLQHKLFRVQNDNCLYQRISQPNDELKYNDCSITLKDMPIKWLGLETMFDGEMIPSDNIFRALFETKFGHIAFMRFSRNIVDFLCNISVRFSNESSFQNAVQLLQDNCNNKLVVTKPNVASLFVVSICPDTERLLSDESVSKYKNDCAILTKLQSECAVELSKASLVVTSSQQEMKAIMDNQSQCKELEDIVIKEKHDTIENLIVGLCSVIAQSEQVVCTLTRKTVVNTSHTTRDILKQQHDIRGKCSDITNHIDSLKQLIAQFVTQQTELLKTARQQARQAHYQHMMTDSAEKLKTIRSKMDDCVVAMTEQDWGAEVEQLLHLCGQRLHTLSSLTTQTSSPSQRFNGALAKALASLTEHFDLISPVMDVMMAFAMFHQFLRKTRQSTLLTLKPTYPGCVGASCYDVGMEAATKTLHCGEDMVSCARTALSECDFCDQQSIATLRSKCAAQKKVFAMASEIDCWMISCRHMQDLCEAEQALLSNTDLALPEYSTLVETFQQEFVPVHTYRIARLVTLLRSGDSATDDAHVSSDGEVEDGHDRAMRNIEVSVLACKELYFKAVHDLLGSISDHKQAKIAEQEETERQLLAEQERLRAEQERQLAEQERLRAEQEAQRAASRLYRKKLLEQKMAALKAREVVGKTTVPPAGAAASVLEPALSTSTAATTLDECSQQQSVQHAAAAREDSTGSEHHDGNDNHCKDGRNRKRSQLYDWANARHCSEVQVGSHVHTDVHLVRPIWVTTAVLDVAFNDDSSHRYISKHFKSIVAAR